MLAITRCDVQTTTKFPFGNVATEGFRRSSAELVDLTSPPNFWPLAEKRWRKISWPQSPRNVTFLSTSLV
jgi:hypothetical protein